MSSHEQTPGSEKHSHGASVRLDPDAHGILERGITELVRMTEGMEFRPLPSDRYPAPLARAVSSEIPDPQRLRRDVQAHMSTDPVGVLEDVLALLELHECNQPDIADHILDDAALTGICFSSKRANGWICITGGADPDELESAINERWQFRFLNGPSRQTGVYPLLNILARYAYVYGRISFGDGHELAHFVEDHTPGLLICRGKMTDLELTLSLAAMKMGVPAIVPRDYPFPLGRTLRADALEEIVEGVVGFRNIRRLLKTPHVPQLPDYCSPEYRKEEITPAVTWGDTPESFYVVRKGSVDLSEFLVTGRPIAGMGVIVTIDAEPLDAFDREYIERKAASDLCMMQGVTARCDDGKLVVQQGVGVDLDPQRVGEVLLAAVRHEFPRLANVRVQVTFDEKVLAERYSAVRNELLQRRREIEAATEETADHFFMCVGCSPFAPDHVCVVTPERGPQCGRPYGMIKTGALYGYDDMSNIHHSALHRDINSFQRIEKGSCLDPDRGEWEGINEGAARLTHGRTRRVYLHSLDETPHTGCGCFRLVMFKTDTPRPGIGIMDREYGGCAPDGRLWRDLHYSLAGKQTDGIAGAAHNYLTSPKFLKGHGGWDSVVWVSPKIAEVMGDSLPNHVIVADA